MAINRYELISRHNPSLKGPDFTSPLSVGNGEFTFTADITGLQTFMDQYDRVPLCTMTQWGWHSFPVDLDESKLKRTPFFTYGREVEYAVDENGQKALYDNLRQNPHRMSLGAIGLCLDKDGQAASLRDLSEIDQRLDMWNGCIHSNFQVFNQTVAIETYADPVQDIVSASIQSLLVTDGCLCAAIRFPYARPSKDPSDWSSPDKHSTEIVVHKEHRLIVKRILDKDVYYADIVFPRRVVIAQRDAHTFLLYGEKGAFEISFSCRFSRYMVEIAPPVFEQVKERSRTHWNAYWQRGGAIQLIHSSDIRAQELERRLVLSQYLTAIQCSGSTPPAETGLTCNSWYGKFHLEMHYWHAAHFPLWGRPEQLEKSLDWYIDILPVARKIAREQGYAGARWPKMCDVSGRNSPSWIAVLLIWQQPHPILMAELCYRAKPCKEFLEKYWDVVEESARFMVSFAHYEDSLDRYVLGPPLIPAQETHAADKALNPAYELEYFRWGLETANVWRSRLGMPEDRIFAQTARKIARLPKHGGVYLAHENCPETFTQPPYFHDHPSMTAALGVLPGVLVELEIMKQTLNKILEVWDFNSMWGWDFAMLAMSAARLGLPDMSVDMLMMDTEKNTYVPCGHNAQAQRADLPLYLPGNGSLLLAAGMMAGGWDGDNGGFAPGFPKNGRFAVEAEGLNKYI